MTPRNEFKNDPLEGLSDLQIQDLLRDGKITVNDVRAHRGLPPCGESTVVEDQDQDREPVGPAEPTKLADLRGVPGGSVTRAHIAERYDNEDIELS